MPITIGGTSYVPPMPMELEVKEHIAGIVSGDGEPIEVVARLCLYCMIMKEQYRRRM